MALVGDKTKVKAQNLKKTGKYCRIEKSRRAEVMLNLVMAPVAQKLFQSLLSISSFLPGPRNDMGMIFHQRKRFTSSVIYNNWL